MRQGSSAQMHGKGRGHASSSSGQTSRVQPQQWENTADTVYGPSYADRPYKGEYLHGPARTMFVQQQRAEATTWQADAMGRERWTMIDSQHADDRLAVCLAADRLQRETDWAASSNPQALLHAHSGGFAHAIMQGSPWDPFGLMHPPLPTEDRYEPVDSDEDAQLELWHLRPRHRVPEARPSEP